MDNSGKEDFLESSSDFSGDTGPKSSVEEDDSNTLLFQNPERSIARSSTIQTKPKDNFWHIDFQNSVDSYPKQVIENKTLAPLPLFKKHRRLSGSSYHTRSNSVDFTPLHSSGEYSGTSNDNPRTVIKHFPWLLNSRIEFHETQYFHPRIDFETASELLRQHPEKHRAICIPSKKETPFFSIVYLKQNQIFHYEAKSAGNRGYRFEDNTICYMTIKSLLQSVNLFPISTEDPIYENLILAFPSQIKESTPLIKKRTSDKEVFDILPNPENVVETFHQLLYIIDPNFKNFFWKIDENEAEKVLKTNPNSREKRNCILCQSSRPEFTFVIVYFHENEIQKDFIIYRDKAFCFEKKKLISFSLENILNILDISPLEVRNINPICKIPSIFGTSFLEHFLISLKLEEWFSKFKKEGINDLHQLLNLKEEKIKKIMKTENGVSPVGPRCFLIASLNELKINN